MFVRRPRVRQVGTGVENRLAGGVGIRCWPVRGRSSCSTFHPELTEDPPRPSLLLRDGAIRHRENGDDLPDSLRRVSVRGARPLRVGAGGLGRLVQAVGDEECPTSVSSVRLTFEDGARSPPRARGQADHRSSRPGRGAVFELDEVLGVIPHTGSTPVRRRRHSLPSHGHLQVHGRRRRSPRRSPPSKERCSSGTGRRGGFRPLATRDPLYRGALAQLTGRPLQAIGRCPSVFKLGQDPDGRARRHAWIRWLQRRQGSPTTTVPPENRRSRATLSARRPTRDRRSAATATAPSATGSRPRTSRSSPTPRKSSSRTWLATSPRRSTSRSASTTPSPRAWSRGPGTGCSRSTGSRLPNGTLLMTSLQLPERAS